MILYKEFGAELINRVKEIYFEEGWMAYLSDDEKLVHAFQNSLYILGAFDGDCLIGFIRCVGDGAHIVLVQDLIVAKEYRKKGTGSALFKTIWEKYADVRMFQVVTEANIEIAAKIHADSWRESHKQFCSADFVNAHTTERQIEYIKKEMILGKVFYLLTLDSPKGIVSVYGNLIENLYVSPDEQRKGYGAMLLHYAESRCIGNPTLWVLNNNIAAQSLYQKTGYVFTGKRKELSNTLEELEMVRKNLCIE